MEKKDILLIQSRQTNFQEIEFIRKDALLDWIKRKLSFEQGYESGEAECAYKDALEDLINDLNKMEE